LKIAKDDEQERNFCFLDYNDPTLRNFGTASATHQTVACNTPDGYSDIVLFVVDVKRIMIIILFHNVRNAID
jgi:hypothetical protein